MAGWSGPDGGGDGGGAVEGGLSSWGRLAVVTGATQHGGEACHSSVAVAAALTTVESVDVRRRSGARHHDEGGEGDGVRRDGSRGEAGGEGGADGGGCGGDASSALSNGSGAVVCGTVDGCNIDP